MKKPYVAVVDDDSAFANYLRTFLSLRGYETRSYSRGDEMLAAVKQGDPPDIVLLDVMMPGMNGLETLRALKAAKPDLQAIMLSGREHASTIVEAVRLGAADYVVKPDDPEGLGEIALDVAIKNAIEKNRLVSELSELRQQLSRLPGVQQVDRESKLHRRPGLDHGLPPRLVPAPGIFPPGEGLLPVRTTDNVGVAVAVDVDGQVTQVFDVAVGIRQVAKMVLDPARARALRGRWSLFVPVFAGDNVQPRVPIDVGHRDALAAAKVERVFAERDFGRPNCPKARRSPNEHRRDQEERQRDGCRQRRAT